MRIALVVAVCLLPLTTIAQSRPATRPSTTAPAATRPSASTQPTTSNDARQLELEKFLKPRLATSNTPAISIAVIYDAKIAWAAAYGRRDSSKPNSPPPDANTLFQAASMSKTVAAVALLTLVQQHKLSLDTDVNESLTSWKVPPSDFTKSTPITLRHLLSHSAGLTVHGFGGYRPNSPKPSLLQVLSGQPPANSPAVVSQSAPGTAFKYSGGGFTVAQQLALDLTHQPFETFLQSAVLTPAGMTRSTFRQPQSLSALGNAATAHTDKGLPIPGAFHVYPELAAAGLWTTPSDYAKFLLALNPATRTFLKPPPETTLLDEPTYQQFITPPTNGSNAALGTFVSGRNRNLNLTHNGANAGFRCTYLYYPNAAAGYVIMGNADDMKLIEAVVAKLRELYRF